MKRKVFLLAATLPALVGLAFLIVPVDVGLAGTLARAYTLAFILALGLWLLARALRVFLWRVSRRLAFSYFLIGIVPIPLATLLVLVAAYLVSGFFLSHLYRDAMVALADDLQGVADKHLEQLARGRLVRSRPQLPTQLAYYRQGKRIAGDRRAPKQWQTWWPSPAAEPVSMVAAADGSPTLLAASSDGRYGVVAVFAGDLSDELSERSGIWVELLRADDPRRAQAAKITLFRHQYPIKPLRPASTREELAEFLHPGVEDPGIVDRPTMIGVDVWQPFRDPATGAPAAEYVSATLTASLRAVHYFLIGRSADVGHWVYLLFVGLAFLLFDIYVIAALMALLLIFGLSRAVNRLTDVTRRVQHGDFSARIEVQRQDQLGALQTSFNTMAKNLERLVAEAAQKEILEKDLSIARELQQSLLPDTLAGPAALSFATHFEPSSAIGGDYYDLLPADGERLAVVVADVSGHGISAGLRMAMVKSALQVLRKQDHTPEEILRRLHRLLRDDLRGPQRGFVTATLALVDSASGELTVTNAGHPPTYHLRAGEVTEILLPSPPLGAALEGDFGRSTLILEPGDVVVWLSDGLIEAQGANDDFGYGRVVDTLTGAGSDPEEVKARLLAAVAEHTGGSAPADDRTLVVMAYQPVAEGGDEPVDSEIAAQHPDIVSVEG